MKIKPKNKISIHIKFNYDSDGPFHHRGEGDAYPTGDLPDDFDDDDQNNDPDYEANVQEADDDDNNIAIDNEHHDNVQQQM